MIFDNLPTAFPWYNKLQKQTRLRAKGEFNFPHLIAPNNCVLPFQFRRAPTGQLPLTWKMYKMETGEEYCDLSDYIINLKVRYVGGWDYIFYATAAPMVIGDPISLKIAQGCYYMVMTFEEGGPMFSETFRIPEDGFGITDLEQINYVRMEWKNYGPLEPIYYPSTEPDLEFYNLIYLDTRITGSEPEIYEEVVKDGNAEEIPLFQKAIIKYRATFFAADYLKIALYCMQIHDSKFIVTANNVEGGQLKDVTVESSPEEGGFLNTVDLIFEQPLVITSTSCVESMVLPDCPEAPTAELLYFSATETDEGVNIVSNPPTSVSSAEIWNTDGTENVLLKRVTRAQIQAGVLILTSQYEYNGFYIKAFSFNCFLVESETINV